MTKAISNRETCVINAVLSFQENGQFFLIFENGKKTSFDSAVAELISDFLLQYNINFGIFIGYK